MNELGINWTSRLVLVAEDSDDDFMLLTRAFQKANFGNPVQRVANGREAISYLAGTVPYGDRMVFPMPYLLLLDLKMPIIGGFDVLQWIRQQEEISRLPVIIFTSSQQPVDIRESYKKGANGFVTKSATIAGLADVVAAIHAYWLKVNRVEI